MVGDATQVFPATAIAIGRRALLLEGPPGSGKSTLALALIDRGAALIGDDAVTLDRVGDRIMASPPPNVSGKLEIRNVGLIDLPATEAPVALILNLQENADRFRESAPMREVMGIAVPSLTFTPGSIAPALRAEWAMRIHGLAFAEAARE